MGASATPPLAIIILRQLLHLEQHTSFCWHLGISLFKWMDSFSDCCAVHSVEPFHFFFRIANGCLTGQGLLSSSVFHCGRAPKLFATELGDAEVFSDSEVPGCSNQ